MTCWNGGAGQFGVSPRLPGSEMKKCRDAKTLARLGQLIGPAVIEQLHRRWWNWRRSEE